MGAPVKVLRRTDVDVRDARNLIILLIIMRGFVLPRVGERAVKGR